MYHDQGQIAMKLMDFEHGVTVLAAASADLDPAQGSALISPVRVSPIRVR